MKRSKFTESQIAFILRQTEEGAAVEEVCRKAGIPIRTRAPTSPKGITPKCGVNTTGVNNIPGGIINTKLPLLAISRPFREDSNTASLRP